MNISEMNSQEISRCMFSATRSGVVASEWLLLYTIKSKEKISSDDIRAEFFRNWKAVHERNPHFYITWPNGYELRKELIRFRNIGILKTSEPNGQEIYWYLTPQGEELLNDFRTQAEKTLRVASRDLPTVQ